MIMFAAGSRYETPGTNLFCNSNSLVSLPNSDKFEIYDYPGEYEKKADGEAETLLAEARVEARSVTREARTERDLLAAEARRIRALLNAALDALDEAEAEEQEEPEAEAA